MPAKKRKIPAAIAPKKKGVHAQFLEDHYFDINDKDVEAGE